MDICKIQNCRQEKIAFSDVCWEHTEKKDEYLKNILTEVKDGRALNGLNFAKVCFRNHDLSRANFNGSNLSRTDFSGANLFDVSFKDAELLGVNFSGADLTGVNFEGADLTKANLFEARLWHANLKSANLIEANIASADLWNANLFDIKLWHSNFSNVSSLSKKNFSHVLNRYITVYRINEKGLNSAEDAYRSLKRHFLASGRYNDASWASFKEKTMEKLLLKKKMDIAYIPSLIMDMLCGYGEKPHRIIISSFAVISFYAFTYFALKAIEYSDIISYQPTIYDNLYYSVVTFTTVGYGDFIPKSLTLYRMLAASEAFIGTFMIGLFIFTLARKYSAR